jgi:hypothetical protein
LSSRRLVLGVTIASIAWLAVLAAACGGGDSDSERLDAMDSRLAAIEDSLAQMQQSQANASLAAALTALNAAQLHDIDEELQRASEIPAGIAGTVRQTRQVVAGVSWPHDFEEEAEALRLALAGLEAALDDDDLAGAKTAAAEAHYAWHLLEAGAYPLLAGEEPAGHGHNGDDDNGHDG